MLEGRSFAVGLGSLSLCFLSGAGCSDLCLRRVR